MKITVDHRDAMQGIDQLRPTNANVQDPQAGHDAKISNAKRTSGVTGHVLAAQKLKSPLRFLPNG